MDKRKRKGRVEIRVNWDNTTGGEWHYVPQSALTVLPTHRLEEGSCVSIKWKGATWTGTMAPKRSKKMSLDQLKRGEILSAVSSCFSEKLSGLSDTPSAPSEAHSGPIETLPGPIETPPGPS